VRLTGHATPVTVNIDGRALSYLAVAEQIDFPNLVCGWPADSGVAPPPDTVAIPLAPPDSGGIPPMPPDTVDVPVDTSGILPPECHVEGTNSMRTLIAWEPEHMAEVVRIVAWIGSSEVNPNVPDVMTELPSGTNPSTTPPDSGSGAGGSPGGFPGFMGEYLVRDVGSWYATGGSHSNDLLQSGGDCTARRATIDWAEFECATAQLRLQFSMGVDPVRYVPLNGVAEPPGGPEGHHAISMAASEVDGVRLTWVAWVPPPLPRDSAGVNVGNDGR
jgi:hypothetical protein